jgi:Ca2+-binding EF-hand superfamily protein
VASFARQQGPIFKGPGMNKLFVTIALGATMMSTQSFAQGRGGSMQDMTRQQAQQMADGMFQRFDLNHDGVVTRQEAEQAGQQFGGGDRVERLIDRTFGTAQSLTLQQFEAQALARFDRDDVNHDGVVTVAERQQARAMLKAERSGQAPMAPQTAPPPPPPGQ